MQQAALAHILNAEGEKLQRVLAYETIAAETILQTNKSVESMVDSVAQLETVLKQKLDLLGGCSCPNQPSL